MVTGPYFDSSRNRWRVMVDGKSRRFTTQAEAETFALEERGRQAAADPALATSLPPVTAGGHAWWSDRLQALAEAMLDALAAGDHARAEQLERAGRVLAQLGHASKGHVASGELEKRLERVERELGPEAKKVRERGPKAARGRLPAPSATPPEPGTPI